MTIHFSTHFDGEIFVNSHIKEISDSTPVPTQVLQNGSASSSTIDIIPKPS